jgi:hypothetical protein
MSMVWWHPRVYEDGYRPVGSVATEFIIKLLLQV